MSWWAWLGVVVLVWTVLGLGLSYFLGGGIGEADRRRPRRRDLTPEDLTGVGPGPTVPVPRRTDRRWRGRGTRVGSPPDGDQDGVTPPPTEDRP
jgi:hypothetical protein